MYDSQQEIVEIIARNMTPKTLAAMILDFNEADELDALAIEVRNVIRWHLSCMVGEIETQQLLHE